jgi:hypothetical protein
MAVNVFTVSATIAASGTISAAVSMEGTDLVGLFMPAAWTAGVLTFQASYDGTNFSDAYDIYGSEITLQTAASRYLAVPPLTLPDLKAIKIRSGTSATPVTQVAQAVLQLRTRHYG